MDQDPEKAARYALSASESQINLGLCLAQQGQFESALETYANADEALATFLNENPLDFQSSISRAKNAINRASLLVGIGRAQEAADVATEGLHGIESFVANEPDHFDLNDCMFKLHGVRGQAHAFLEVWDAAANDWRDAQNFAPDPRWSLECQAQQSLCLVRTGHTSEAVELCDEILKGQPSDDTVYNCICTLALAASTIDKAAQAFSSGNFDKTSQLEQAGHLKQLAIDRLEALRQRGYFDHELKAAHALVDTDLDYLRDDAGQLPVEIE